MDNAARPSVQPGGQTPSSRTGRSPAERLLNIGQVVSLLQPDFPDLSITKLRYLEDRGLVRPVRTKGRYRKYSSADVRRLRMILTLQRDEYLPLDVIRLRVEAGATPGQLLVPGTVGGRTGVAVRREEPVHTLQDVCESAGADAQFVQLLLEYRLIDPPDSSGKLFTDSDVETARICHLLTRFGVEPRNLRLLVSSTEREAAILEQIVTPSLKSSHQDKREYGEKLLSDLGGLFAQLLQLLLYKELRRLF
jgi:DNA-binding transcriptional MerR regulator